MAVVIYTERKASRGDATTTNTPREDESDNVDDMCEKELGDQQMM